MIFAKQIINNLDLREHFPWGFPGSSDSKESAYNAAQPGSIPGSGRSPGEGNVNPLQYSCLENPLERGAWWADCESVRTERLTHISILKTQPT